MYVQWAMCKVKARFVLCDLYNTLLQLKKPHTHTHTLPQDAGLASFCPNSIPRVPAILVHCVTEIERRGLTDVGIYRVPGSV